MMSTAVETANEIMSILDVDNEYFTDGSQSMAVLPKRVYSDYILYPNYAILVMKAEDLAVISKGKGNEIRSLEKLMTLDFYDERVRFFQHTNHLGHIAFVGMLSENAIQDGDFGKAVSRYHHELTRMFGDLSIQRNYTAYYKACPINESYKFLTLMDATHLITTNKRILAVANKDGSMDVYRVHA